MKKTGIINEIVAYGLVGALAVTAVTLYRKYDSQLQSTTELKSQLDMLTRQEQRSAVMQSVNAQMEEIALQERRISDEQREAAEEQTRVAERMRRNAEEERQNALVAEQRAVEASEVAKSQRLIAEHQRTEAEYAKRVADTLSYLTLARQLGNMATTQYQAGNTELANLLTYTAYMYTQRYDGDLFAPSIYQALVLTSQSMHQWNKHKGAISNIVFWEDDSYNFVTCSTYGELSEHTLTGTQLTSTPLFANKNFDFRDVLLDRTTRDCYAVSRHGWLLIRHNGSNTLLPLEGMGHPMAIERLGKHLVIIGETALALFDPTTRKVTATHRLQYKTVSLSRYDNTPVLFDDHGQQLVVHSMDRIETSPVPVKGQVTAFASSKSSGLKVYGMMDGTIWLIDNKGKSQQLVGHRSRVSRLKIAGWRIYSASYDGTLNLWKADMAKIEPMTIIRTAGWLMSFTFDKQKVNIWSGDHKGNLTQSFISVPMMINKLKSQLTRNLTRQEWQYYIGSNIPYEKLKIEH